MFEVIQKVAIGRKMASKSSEVDKAIVTVSAVFENLNEYALTSLRCHLDCLIVDVWPMDMV
jgi:hypothetical protein